VILIRDAEVENRRVDVRIADGSVTEVGVGLVHGAGEEVLDADGAALVPGLVDHHLHLHALAAAGRSAACGPPAVHDAAALAAALAAAPADEHGWVRGVGYHETVAGHLDVAALDALHPARPVRLQHRSGALWIVNSAAACRLGLPDAEHPGIERAPGGAPTGRLWRADDWLRSRLPDLGLPDLSAVGARLAALGITSVTDATPDLDPASLDALAGAVTNGALPQQVHVLGAPLGSAPPAPLTAGPYKIVLADSGLPDLDTLSQTIRTAHAFGRPVAAHCVTREAFVLLLAALEDAGSVRGDRVEHAALVPVELLGDLERRGVRVVTQPGFLADRGDDYIREIPGTEHPDLYRCRSLLDAGVPLALSSDAPYGPVDPWTVIAAATRRRTSSGAILGPAERLTPAAALAAYLAPPDDPGGPPRRIRPGARADLVLLRKPLAAALAEVPATPVRAVLFGGRRVPAR
jgi:predicted amidohydrolase YtcJ